MLIARKIGDEPVVDDILKAFMNRLVRTGGGGANMEWTPLEVKNQP